MRAQQIVGFRSLEHSLVPGFKSRLWNLVDLDLETIMVRSLDLSLFIYKVGILVISPLATFTNPVDEHKTNAWSMQ